MEPVPLTSKQIQEIIKAIPRPRGVGKTALEVARKHHVERLREELNNIKLVPLQEAFDEFKEEIVRSNVRALVEQGLPVGIMAGVALGKPITQLSLNSFHFAG